MTAPDTLRPLALEIISDHLADCDYVFGDKVISDVLIIWISKLVKCPHDYIKELDKVIFSTKAQAQAQTWDALGKWARQNREYYRQVSSEPVDRWGPPVFTLADARAQDKVDLMRGKILDLLESLGKDNGIRFMSILMVEWARRLNSDDFIRTMQNRGYAVSPESIDIVPTTLWFMEDAFHL